jgi:hypothetical protein
MAVGQERDLSRIQSMVRSLRSPVCLMYGGPLQLDLGEEIYFWQRVLIAADLAFLPMAGAVRIRHIGMVESGGFISFFVMPLLRCSRLCYSRYGLL